MKIPYQQPVATLLEYGDYDEKVFSSVWPDYVKEFSLSTKDIPQLIQMACDTDLFEAGYGDPRIWAPVHAWRALGQLRATEAIGPLVKLLENSEDDGEVSDEIPEVLGMIGPAIIEPLSQALKENHSQTWTAICIAESFYYLVQKYPEATDQCISTLTNQLKCCQDNDSELNGFLVSYLIDLKAVESLDIIRNGFQKGTVDIGITGDLEAVEAELRCHTKRLGLSHDREEDSLH